MKYITILICLFAINVKGQIAIFGGMPVNKSINSVYSFSYGGQIGYYKDPKHRFGFSGIRLTGIWFNQKNNNILDPVLAPINPLTIYTLEMGLKYYIINNFAVGCDVGYAWVNIENRQAFCMTPFITYDINRFQIFQNYKWLEIKDLGYNLSTINIGIAYKIWE